MPAAFSEYVALLTELLNYQQAIVDRIETRLLNVQGKDICRTRDYPVVERPFNSCVYESPGLPPGLARLAEQLHAAHVEEGFEPVLLERTSHQLNPLELIVRAYDTWEQQRWPGRNGRLAFARVLFGVHMLRLLEAVALRVWDDGSEGAAERLEQIQTILDVLNATAGPNVLVRDARWLIQTAQGPLTRHLGPYFTVADRIAASFPDRCRLEIHSAGAKLAGGHLRSQLRYRSSELGQPIDDPGVLATTRNSNSMDGALLVRDLVGLLEAYESARRDGDAAAADLCDAIFQGISADPELLVTRFDLLEPCTAIDYLFVEHRDGAATRTPTGARHHAMLARYRELMARLAAPLRDDAAAMDPSQRPYSPLGIVYGFCGDILTDMALGTLDAPPVVGISLEDLFDSRGDQPRTLARARHWEQKPARADGRERFEHSTSWAIEVFQRTAAALDARAAHGSTLNASTTRAARVFVIRRTETSGSRPQGAFPDDAVPAQEHCVTSDVSRALSTGATAFPRSQFLNDRNEGRYLASREIAGKWFGVSKTILTGVISQGRDGVIVDVPEPVLDVLRVTCPGLIASD